MAVSPGVKIDSVESCREKGLNPGIGSHIAQG